MVNPYYTDHFCQYHISKKGPQNVLLIRFPQPVGPLSELTLPFPSKATRSPISLIPNERSPRPSPSPEGKPESSNSALKDSMCGATNSLRIGAVDPLSVGFLKDSSRARVLNVGFGLDREDSSGIAALIENDELKSWKSRGL